MGGVRALAPRADRGRHGRDEGALRVRVRRLPPHPPDGPDRLPLPRRRVAPQGDRAGRARPPAGARQLRSGRPVLAGARRAAAARVAAHERARRCRSTGRGRSGSTAATGTGCRCPRTGSCTATARRPTRTSPTRSRSSRRTCPTRTRRATTARAFAVPGEWRGGGRGAALRGRRLVPAGVAQRRRARRRAMGSRLPAEFDVGRAAAAGRGERARGARAPVVGRRPTSRTRTCGGCRGSSAASTLLARPAGALDDVFVHADYDHATGTGTLRVDAGRARARDACRSSASTSRRGRPSRRRRSSRGAPSSRASTTPRSRARASACALRIGFRTVAVEDGAAAGQRPPRAVARRQPPRVRSRPRPRGVRGGHAARRAC